MIKIFKSKKKESQVYRDYDRILDLWNITYEEKDLITTWGTTHCITAGERSLPPLILFHGVGDNSAVMWALNIKDLSRHFYCIAIDTLGGPGKSVPNAHYNKNNFDQIKWIDEVVNLLGLDHFSILGISNGAVMAYNYLVRRSERIHKVIAMEGGMITENPLITMMKTMGLLFPQILLPTKNNMIGILKKLTSPESNFIKKHPEIITHMILLMNSHNQMAMTPHLIEIYDKEKGLAVRDKLLFFVGDHGLSKKRKFLDVLIEGNYSYKLIKAAGHGVNHEQPEEVNKEIIDFLKA